MKEWLNFFIGTPKRFLVCCVVIAAAAVVSKIWPGVIQSSLTSLTHEVRPIFESLLVLVVILIGLKFVFSGLRSKPKKK